MKKITDWFKRYRQHFIFWAIYIFYESVIAEMLVTKHGSPLAYIFHYSLVIGIVYFHYGILLPKTLKDKNKIVWRLPLGYLIEISVFVLLYYLEDIWLTSINVYLMDGKPNLKLPYWLIHAYRGTYYLIVSSAYYFIRNYINETRRSRELEKQKLNEVIKRQKIEQELTHAQNAFLKAQINPHFLFNTLDFVYHNVEELSPTAAEAIISLSEMMRFAIDADKMGEFIYIGEEIEQVQNLQYLNRLRKNEDMPLKLVYTDEVYHVSFIPLVLLTLAENIFKHGDIHYGKEAVMELYIEKGLFVIKTDNVSNRQKPSTSHRTGLINIEQRLKYAYGDGVYFNYHQDNDQHFRLTIKVPVQQLQGVSAPSSFLANIGTI
jgi:two-component system LytT family sensor kinase